MTDKTKKLYLLRHGEAEDFSVNNNDVLRKLTDAGRAQINQIAQYIKENHIKIDQIISSPAERAKESAEIIKKLLNLHDIIYVDNLYPSTTSSIYDAIVATEDKINSILIIGHNPGLSSFAQEYMQFNAASLPTSGIIACTYDTASWAEFALVTAKRNFVTSPK
ncbi:MAG: phosphohistidine phosphatase SixA [Bacteroidetes bacterium]|nr:MAG: phosphohistidine phosphatase SixA [Bacteroidota bacterium]